MSNDGSRGAGFNLASTQKRSCTRFSLRAKILAALVTLGFFVILSLWVSPQLDNLATLPQHVARSLQKPTLSVRDMIGQMTIVRSNEFGFDTVPKLIMKFSLM